MFSPRARRITPLVTIPAGVARLFLDFFTVPPTQVEAIDLNRPGRFGERPLPIFLAQAKRRRHERARPNAIRRPSRKAVPCLGTRFP